MQLPFGITTASLEYTNASKAVIDLGKNLLRDEYWDTENLNLPHRYSFPNEDIKKSSNHLAKADPLAVEITAIEASMYRFIRDIITITVDDNHWIERAKSADLLIIHTLFQPLQPSAPLKRYNPLSLRKLVAEGKLADKKICLGWDIHTHSLRVFTPK